MRSEATPPTTMSGRGRGRGGQSSAGPPPGRGRGRGRGGEAAGVGDSRGGRGKGRGRGRGGDGSPRASSPRASRSPARARSPPRSPRASAAQKSPGTVEKYLGEAAGGDGDDDAILAFDSPRGINSPADDLFAAATDTSEEESFRGKDEAQERARAKEKEAAELRERVRSTLARFYLLPLRSHSLRGGPNLARLRRLFAN